LIEHHILLRSRRYVVHSTQDAGRSIGFNSQRMHGVASGRYADFPHALRNSSQLVEGWTRLAQESPLL
jgi:hypothetical protein